MRRTRRLFLALFAIAVSSACRSAEGIAPVILYGSAPRPPGEIAVVQVVKNRAGRGHATIDIRAITRMEDAPVVLYQAQEGRAWSPPEHFGGPPDTQRHAPQGDPGAVPVHFELLPGTYEILFLYVPVVDRWGYTHKRNEAETTLLNCKAGHVYYLEGKLEEEGGIWYLTSTEEVAGEEGQYPSRPRR